MVCDHELTWDMVHYDVQMIGGIHEAYRVLVGFADQLAHGDNQLVQAAANLADLVTAEIRQLQGEVAFAVELARQLADLAY